MWRHYNQSLLAKAKKLCYFEVKARFSSLINLLSHKLVVNRNEVSNKNLVVFRKKPMSLNKNVWLLMLAGAFGLCIAPMVVFIGGLIGTELAPSEHLATLPVAAIVVGTALAIIPVSSLMSKYGRKTIFISSALFSSFAALLAAFSIYHESFWGFTFSVACLGSALAVLQQYRFAAMESVKADKIAQAASFVLLGGLIAAILGPELATLGRDVFEQHYVGSFCLLAITSLMGAVFLNFYQAKPLSSEPMMSQPRHLTGLMKNKLFWVAIMSSTIGYAVMSYIMTATPVSMHIIMGHNLEDTKWVIQSHILAMFLPSLFSGFLANKFGLKTLMFMGLVCYSICIGLTISGSSVMHYWGGLVLLGLGWNFLFVSGTLLLATTYSDQERFKAQGFHDFFVFGSQAFASISSGVVIYSLGWEALLLLALPFVLLQFLVMFAGFKSTSRIEKFVSQKEC
jgi:MFS family permease